jgi:hypothetical protein
MARKKLLSEGEVRQFMKLANLGALSENYFSNTLEEEEEEVVVDEFPPAEEEEVVDELPGEEDMGLEAADEGAEGLVMSLLQRVQDWAEENGVEMDLDGGEGGDELEDAELEDEAPLPDEEMGMDVEAEEEIPMQEDELYEGDLAEVGQVASIRHPKTREPGVSRSAERDPKSACAPGERWNADLKQCDPVKASSAGKQKATGTHGRQDEAMVAEVVRRVAARLKSAKQTATVADQLAERIFDRLTSKSK